MIILDISRREDDKFTLDWMTKEILRERPRVLVINSYQQSVLSMNQELPILDPIEIRLVDRDSRQDEVR